MSDSKNDTIVPIRVNNPALSDSELRGGMLILLGTLANESLQHLRYGPYQREKLPAKARANILDALKNGQPLPIVELGMRGHRTEKGPGKSELLNNPVYVIDGQQRIKTAIEFSANNPFSPVAIQCVVHFDTDEAWERERFVVLNRTPVRVSPNIILRNYKESHVGVATLYGLCHNDPRFALHKRVSWDQQMTREELTTARLLAQVVNNLHSHKVALAGNRELETVLDRVNKAFGNEHMRNNTRAFFDLMDDCFGVRKVHYRQHNVQMAGPFMMTLARFLADHTDFWRGADQKELFVEASLRAKIKSFPLSDPEIERLAASYGRSIQTLYERFAAHVNSGKRTRHLTKRTVYTTVTDTGDVIMVKQ